MKNSSVKVGVTTDQTGPLSFMGIANANVAKMVINDINANGGLLGRKIDLCLEDSATNGRVAEAKATKFVQKDQVDVIFGGIYSSTRQMNMHIAQSNNGHIKIVKRLGVIDPKECVQGIK